MRSVWPTRRFLREENQSLRDEIVRIRQEFAARDKALRWWRQVFACRVVNLPREGQSLQSVRWKLVKSDARS